VFRSKILLLGSGWVCNLWFGFGFGIFPPKNSKFFNFLPLRSIKISSGWLKKYPGQSQVGFLFTMGQKCARVGSVHISTLWLGIWGLWVWTWHLWQPLTSGCHKSLQKEIPSQHSKCLSHLSIKNPPSCKRIWWNFSWSWTLESNNCFWLSYTFWHTIWIVANVVLWVKSKATYTWSFNCNACCTLEKPVVKTFWK